MSITNSNSNISIQKLEKSQTESKDESSQNVPVNAFKHNNTDNLVLYKENIKEDFDNFNFEFFPKHKIKLSDYIITDYGKQIKEIYNKFILKFSKKVIVGNCN